MRIFEKAGRGGAKKTESMNSANTYTFPIAFIVSFATAEAVLRFTEIGSEYTAVNQKWLLSSMTGLRACIFVAINLHYLWHLLKRPYLSHPHSKRIGDPLNDAEIFTTRALNWAAAWVALQAVADGSTPTEHILEDR